MEAKRVQLEDGTTGIFFRIEKILVVPGTKKKEEVSAKETEGEEYPVIRTIVVHHALLHAARAWIKVNKDLLEQIENVP